MSGWAVYVLCDCGWRREAPHGNPWFVETRHPVCPDCARPMKKASLVTARERGFWKRTFEIKDS